MVANSTNLEATFPDIIDTIKAYASVDQDFERLCKDFDELSELVLRLEAPDVVELDYVKARVCEYKRQKTALINEINNFILEDK